MQSASLPRGAYSSQVWEPSSTSSPARSVDTAQTAIHRTRLDLAQTSACFCWAKEVRLMVFLNGDQRRPRGAARPCFSLIAVAATRRARANGTPPLVAARRLTLQREGSY